MNRVISRAANYFGGRRRVYWGQQAGYYPPFSLSATPGGFTKLATLIPLAGLGFLLYKGLKRR